MSDKKMNINTQEEKNIIQRYKRRIDKDRSDLYNMARSSVRIASFEKNLHWIKILTNNFGADFIHKKYLEVGCGTGTNLTTLISWGIPPAALAGNDIFSLSLDIAKERLPNSIQLKEGNFLNCKYEEKFDVIIFSTVLSSILDVDFQKTCIKYAYDLLNKGGIVLLYDFIYNNPWNKDVRGVNINNFISCAKWKCWNFKKITLCPPLARKLEKIPLLIKFLGKLKLLNTHKVGFLKK